VFGWPLYQPPAFFWWWFAYDAYARDVFVEGAYIAASGGIAAVIGAIAMSVWRAREMKRVTTYGSARWAETREVREASLLGHDGVLLGRWRDHYLRHDGPEHVLCFAPTRSGTTPVDGCRAAKLERLGLAEQVGPAQWTLKSGIEPALRGLGIRGDVIKTLHRAMTDVGREPDVAGFTLHGDEASEPVLGRLVERGPHDELSGTARNYRRRRCAHAPSRLLRPGDDWRRQTRRHR